MQFGAAPGRSVGPALLVAMLVAGSSGCDSERRQRAGAAPGACCSVPAPAAGTPARSSAQVTTSGPAPPTRTRPRRVTPEALLRRSPTGVARQQPRPSPSINAHDPLVVASDYVTVRNTYRYDEPAGYAVALTAPAYTTAAFAARSRPSAAELARVRTAQEVSTVRVLTAQVDGEAPNTATSRYVDVAFLNTQAYRGDGSGRPQQELWTLRLLRDHAGRWRVDGVPGTS